MNVGQDPDRSINPSVWGHPEMRAALATRDIATVFRLLQRAGISQRRIAALTGQSQSEISEIRGGRQVMAYDVLARIADGLGVPRGAMGLAYDHTTADFATASHPDASVAEGRDDARQMLSRAAEVTIGAAVIDPAIWTTRIPSVQAPIPSRLGSADVLRLECVTAGMRALDYEHGGGVCRDAVVAQVGWAQQLLRTVHSDGVGRRLHLALADLHSLAAWTSFDVGLHKAASQHFVLALELARHADEPALVAKMLYGIARLQLHRGQVVDGLKFLQLGQLAAQESGCGLAVAMLCANEAWAYALLGQSAQALKSIGRAQDEFARADRSDAPVWVRFFSSADLDALVAMACTFLPAPTAVQRAEAISRFNRSIAERGTGMARSRAFELTALAVVHLRDGNLDVGASVGDQAARLAAQVRSVRVVDRLRPLLEAADQHRSHPDVRDLAERLVTLQSL